MLIQELSQKGKPLPGRVRDVSPEFWERLKSHWGKRLRWTEVKAKQPQEATQPTAKHKKNERK